MTIKLLAGSNYLFNSVTNFSGQDTDYIVIKPTPTIFKHKHTKDNICLFIWDTNKENVRKYIDQIPQYLNVVSFVHQLFVEYFEYTHIEVVRMIDRVSHLFKASEYAYYIPFFEHIKNNFNWDFPESVVNEAYQIYLKVKKKA